MPHNHLVEKKPDGVPDRSRIQVDVEEALWEGIKRVAEAREWSHAKVAKKLLRWMDDLISSGGYDPKRLEEMYGDGANLLRLAKLGLRVDRGKRSGEEAHGLGR